MRSSLFIPALAAAFTLSAAAFAGNAAAQTNAPQTQTFPAPKAQAPKVPTTPSPQMIARVNLQSAQTLQQVCPLRMSASQKGMPATVWTIAHEDAGDPNIFRAVDRRSPGYGIHVSLGPSMLIQMPPTILRAELSVDYLAPGTRMVPVSARYQPPTRSKTFTVHAGDLPSYELAADLLIGQTSGILRVHLVSVEYTNGETWTTPRPDTCTASPSLFVPVGAR